MERQIQETPTTASMDQIIDPHQSNHDSLSNDQQPGMGTRLLDKIRPAASDISSKLDGAMPDKEQTERMGRSLLGNMKNTLQTVRQKAPEFMMAHKKEIIMGLGTYATGRLISGKAKSKAQMSIPARAKAISKLQTLPTDAKSKIHEMTA